MACRRRSIASLRVTSRSTTGRAGPTRRRLIQHGRLRISCGGAATRRLSQTAASTLPRFSRGRRPVTRPHRTPPSRAGRSTASSRGDPRSTLCGISLAMRERHIRSGMASTQSSGTFSRVSRYSISRRVTATAIADRKFSSTIRMRFELSLPTGIKAGSRTSASSTTTATLRPMQPASRLWSSRAAQARRRLSARRAITWPSGVCGLRSIRSRWTSRACAAPLAISCCFSMTWSLSA